MNANKLSQPTGFLYRIDRAINLSVPPVDVFDFVTTPAFWTLWRPATQEVFDPTDHPLLYGEIVTEILSIAGRRLNAEWSVIASEAPYLWAMATDTPLGEARITYRLSPSPQGTRLIRTIAYRCHHAPLRWLDNTVLRWILTRHTERALKRLKQILEANTLPPD